MATTTLEKSFFIVFGLLIFMSVGLPLFSLSQEILDKNSEINKFNSIVQEIRDSIESVELNNSYIYQEYINIPENLTLQLIQNSTAIKISLNRTGLTLEEIVHSSQFPIVLQFQEGFGEYLLTCQLVKNQINLTLLKKQ
ncbi:MAG: hypothetical protein ACTSYF_11665 [Promethearchaeota archaeon]